MMYPGCRCIYGNGVLRSGRCARTRYDIVTLLPVLEMSEQSLAVAVMVPVSADASTAGGSADSGMVVTHCDYSIVHAK